MGGPLRRTPRPGRQRTEPVSLDPENARLRRGTESLGLRPKDLAVLQQLIERRGRLVTKGTLLSAAWPDVFVTEAVLKASINRLRAALEDDARTPRFIETVHRRGYRLVGEILLADATPGRPSAPGWLVGRGAELADLDRRFGLAAAGTRQVAFVSGEAGLGKTALVDLFLEARVPMGLRVGRGQCVEHYGSGEAYRPVFEALGRLGHGPGGRAIVRVLAQHAPTWLAQMPGLFSSRNAEAIRRRTIGATRERMLRELADAFDVLTRETPLVLVLEDLHWSDASTLDVIAALARRRDSARLLVLGTYRPEEVLPDDHPLPALVRDLQLHRLSVELPLPPLTESAVETYLSARFPGAALPSGLPRAVHRRTDGHPLFLVAMAEHLVAHGFLVQARGRWEARGALEGLARVVPADVRQMIEARLDRLSATERRLVEAASVAGVEFSAASAAAALEEPVSETDERYARLARRRLLLHASGEEAWADGTVAGRYGFLHAVYQEVAYAQVPVARRIELHRRVATREEAGHAREAGQIAARLAMHFEQGQDHRSAARYHLQAGRNAIELGAYREAIGHGTAGLASLQRVADTPDRKEQELGLELLVGIATAATRGYAASEAESAYARVLALSRDLGDGSGSASALAGLFAYHLIRGSARTARELAEQILAQAGRSGVPALVLWGHMTLAVSCLQRGEAAPARAHFEEALSRYDPGQRDVYLAIHRQEPAVVCFGYLSWSLWMLGYPAQAVERGRAAAAAAERTRQPIDLVHALVLASVLHYFRLEPPRARHCAEAAVRLSSEYGLAHWLATSTVIRGWARSAQGALAEGEADMRAGIEAWQSVGAEYAMPLHLAMLGEALGRAGRIHDAQEALTRALRIAETNGERFWEPEVHRLRGELLLRTAELRPEDERARVLEDAEEALQRALDLARAQQARSLEVRAARTLCRLAGLRGDPRPALARLADLYGWFTEGFDTRDLRDARALLRVGGDAQSAQASGKVRRRASG